MEETNGDYEELKHIDYFGTLISWTCPEGQFSIIRDLIQTGETGYITYSNVHVVVTSRKDEALRNALQHAQLVSPDGMPLAVVGKMVGARCMAKCSGPDMMDLVLKMGVPLGYTHYFFGSLPETLTQLAEKLNERYPGIQIAGMYSPPFRPMTAEEDEALVAEINRISPDFIWVGLGAPKQELWMYQHREAFHKGLMMGVGAAFDFHAGTLKRAPEWMQRSGLEWFYRLIKEPGRLWKRYFVTNTLFLYYLLRYGVRIVDDGVNETTINMPCAHNGNTRSCWKNWTTGNKSNT